MSKQRLMTVEEVCEYLRMSRDTLYYARYQGRGPKGYRVGRRLLFKPEDVEAWLESRADDAA
ncbi:MAG: helix-turn-helix domain-containing protein [Actinomycetota bacterium]|nr:helix-turn-helix domain-containing protein [Actinomycetota bacterium]